MKSFFLFLIFTFYVPSFAQENIQLKIDKRIEAISIFYTLAPRDTLDIKPTPSKYYQDFDTNFDKCRNHQSLNWYRNLNTWDGFDLSIIGLFLTDKYPFKLAIPYDGTQLRSSDMKTFLEKFNKFYKDSYVEKFIASHEKEYSKITRFAKQSIIESKILEDVQEFYNKPSNGEILIFADILNNLGSNAIEINARPYQDKKMFKLAYLEDENVIQTNETDVKFIPLSNVVIHEISHLYLNDFIPKYKERLNEKKFLFLTTVNNEMLPKKEWENELDELIVRVCVSKILGEKYGVEREQSEVENQSKHYKHFKELNLLFDKYVKDRTKYKSITDFYPEIMNFIEKLE